jgi:hypothetical protein
MFKVDRAMVAAMLEDDPALGTLRNQYSVDEIWALLENPESLKSDEDLFNALMDVTYATRPKGFL